MAIIQILVYDCVMVMVLNLHEWQTSIVFRKPGYLEWTEFSNRGRKYIFTCFLRNVTEVARCKPGI